MIIYRFLPAFLSRVAILLGLVLGTIVAIPFGVTDFGRIADASIFQFTLPFHFGLPTFEVGATMSMFVVMLVIMTETTADILAIGEMVDKPGRPADGHQRAARRHARPPPSPASSTGSRCSAFAQNVGLVAITGIKSRFVVAVGGGILVLLGLFPMLGALIAVVPLPVLGGAGIALFGTVAASGIRTLAKVDFSGNANLVIVAFAIGMGIIPIAVPNVLDEFPDWFTVIFDSGITAAAITAVAAEHRLQQHHRSPSRHRGPDLRRGPPPGRDLRCRRGPPHRPTQEPRDPALTLAAPSVSHVYVGNPHCTQDVPGYGVVFWVQRGRRPA